MFAQLSLKYRLSIVFGGVIVATVIIFLILFSLHARGRIKIEAESAFGLAENFVKNALSQVDRPSLQRKELESLVQQAQTLRHVRVWMENRQTEISVVKEIETAPAWFSALLAPEIKKAHIPLLDYGHAHESIEIETSAKDESLKYGMRLSGLPLAHSARCFSYYRRFIFWLSVRCAA